MDQNIWRAATHLRTTWEQSNLKECTVQRLEYNLGLLEQYAAQRGVSDMSRELAEEYIESVEKEGLSISTTRFRLQALRQICDTTNVEVPFFNHYRNKREMRQYFVPEKFAAAYEEFITAARRSGKWADSTAAAAGQCVRMLLDFLGTRVDDLRDVAIEDMDAFMSSRSEDLSHGYLRNIRSAACAFLKYGIENLGMNEQLTSFCEEKVKHRPHPPQRFLTPDEVDKILDAARTTAHNPKRSFAVAVIFLQYMPRSKDLRELSFDDINWLENTITIGSSKNGKKRVYPLTSSARYALLDYIKNEREKTRHRKVFTQVQYPHDPLKASGGLNATIKRLAREAGVGDEGGSVSCHTMRRTGATLLMNEGFEYPAISTVLQHTFTNSHSTDMTMTYLKIDMPTLKPAALEVIDDE